MENNLQKQLRIFVINLQVYGDENNNDLVKKMITQAHIWISPLNVFGTGEEYGCDPRHSENGLEMCSKHFIHCGAAKDFGESWQNSHR